MDSCCLTILWVSFEFSITKLCHSRIVHTARLEEIVWPWHALRPYNSTRKHTRRCRITKPTFRASIIRTSCPFNSTASSPPQQAWLLPLPMSVHDISLERTLETSSHNHLFPQSQIPIYVRDPLYYWGLRLSMYRIGSGTVIHETHPSLEYRIAPGNGDPLSAHLEIAPQMTFA